jgi:2-keto-4-pentenoate hydratase/2-oxohepta-3-ene-1,7-dioic acid hydratase in catechol pathway
MKIICIGRNYANHAKEMGSAIPTEPVFFMKPDTALLKEGDFYHPDFSEEVHHEIEVVVKISKVGKNIDEKFAHKYYNEISLGIDFTARDLQEKCKEKGLPWEKAKAFDNAAILGQWHPLTKEILSAPIRYTLSKNGSTVQTGDSSLMIFPLDKILAGITEYFTIHPGDLIYTGTPAGVGPTAKGDVFEGFFEGQSVFSLKVNP